MTFRRLAVAAAELVVAVAAGLVVDLVVVGGVMFLVTLIWLGQVIE